MTSTTVAVADEEYIMSTKDARALNKKIQLAAQQADTAIHTLMDPIEEAHNGNIHLALGYKSWTGWITDNVKITASDKN